MKGGEAAAVAAAAAVAGRAGEGKKKGGRKGELLLHHPGGWKGRRGGRGDRMDISELVGPPISGFSYLYFFLREGRREQVWSLEFITVGGRRASLFLLLLLGASTDERAELWAVDEGGREGNI